MSEFAIAEVFPGRLNALVKNLMSQMAISDPNEAVRRVNAGEWVVIKVVESILSLVNGNVASDAIESFDPHTFYEPRDGLWISNPFRDNVLAKAHAIKKLPAKALKSFDLVQNAYDRDITLCLPQNYEFSIDEALARIAQLIEKQWGGKEGELLNNRYANPFYVPGFVVVVYWHADLRTWRVHAWERDAYHWFAGSRAFSAN